MSFNYSLPLDRTGQSESNRREREHHTLPDKRLRAIAPLNGAFYVDTVKVYQQGSEQSLEVGVDYRFSALNPTATHLYKRDVASLIIITNPDVSKEVEVSYNAVGHYYMRSANAIEEMINNPVAQDFSKDFMDIFNAPTEIRAYDHIHDGGDTVGLEYLCFMLEHLIHAQSWGNARLIQVLINKIDNFLNDLSKWASIRFDEELFTYLDDYRKKFNKAYLQLDKVVNMRTASPEEVTQAAAGTLVVQTENENAYITLKGLSRFKEYVASHLVSSANTFLGKRYGTIIASRLETYASLVNGARAIIDCVDNVSILNVPYDGTAYPNTTDTSAQWAIHKVINNPKDYGGVVQAINCKTGQAYNGILTVNSAGQYNMKWVRLFGQAESSEFLRQLYAHIAKENAHNVTAAHLKLDRVANYPVASVAEVLQRQPMKAYITHEGALALLAAFNIDDYKLKTDPDGSVSEEQEAEQLRRYQNLFMNCSGCGKSGGCGCDDGKLELKAQLFEPTKAIDAYGVEYGFYCEGTKRVSVIADGLGGIKNIEFLADDYCTGQFSGSVSRFAIRERGGVVIGYGYNGLNDRDPRATVEFKGNAGIVLCHIYPTSGTGHTVAIRDYTNTIIGYAMNP